MTCTRVITLAALIGATLGSLTGCPESAAPVEAPVVAITSPKAGEIVTKRRVTVKGTAERAREVMINGQVVSVVGGSWSALVEFPEGQAQATATAGEATDSVAFTVDSVGPTLAVTSPARGAYIGEVDRVTVSGSVEELGSGLSLVKLGEQIVAVGEDGTFSGDVIVQPGYNQLTVTAIDKAGHESQRVLAVMAGATTDPTEAINPAFDIFVGPDAIGTATDAIRQVATPEFVLGYLKSALMIDGVSIDSLAYDPLDVTITPRSNAQNPGQRGYLEFDLLVKNLVLNGSFTFGGEVIQLEVKVASATVTTTAELDVDGRSGLEITFGQSELDLGADGIDWQVKTGDGTLSSEDVAFLERTVENVARTAFSQLLSERLIDQLYDPNILKRKIALLGRELAFEVQLKNIIVNASGILVQTGLKMPAEAAPEVRKVPGALLLPTGPQEAPTLETGVVATTDHAALNRVLHGIWRSGLFHQQLIGADLVGLELPFALTSDALALAIDGRVANHSSGDAEAALVLRPALPPVVELIPAEAQVNGGATRVRLGELHLDMILDARTNAPQKLLTLALFIDLDLHVTIDDANQLQISFTPTVSVDLIDEPLFDLDDANTEGILLELARLIPTLIEQNLAIGGEADFLWFRATNPSLEVHGLDKDQLSAGFDLISNPGALMP